MQMILMLLTLFVLGFFLLKIVGMAWAAIKVGTSLLFLLSIPGLFALGLVAAGVGVLATMGFLVKKMFFK